MHHFKPALLFVLVFTVLTGLVYPLAVTAVAALVFPHEAGGSLIHRDGRVVGSALIGQPFTGARYFWSRPSATAVPYDGAASAGSNLGPSNPVLYDRVAATVARLVEAHGEGTVPVDLATASASGLDPHVTPGAALYQVARVARARGLSEDAVRELVRAHTEGRDLGFLGEPRVDVLELNLALDALGGGAGARESR